MSCKVLTLGLNLDELHPRVLRLASVYPITQVAEPCARAPAPDLLDARVFVASRDSVASDGDPILVAAVLEGDGDGLRVLLDVVELSEMRSVSH